MRLLLPLVLAVGCVKATPPSMHPAEVVAVTTDDGWSLDLRHYPGEGEPVLLVHGMGANHYNWDYDDTISLARELGDQGWDVWVPELRGDPGSTAPSRRALRSYTFDDHARYDLPAHVDAVLAATGEPSLYWVGHSMGGMLLYTAARDYPDKIEGGVAVCSPATLAYPNGLHKLARGFGWAMGGRGRIHQVAMVKALGGGRALPVWGMLSNRDNIEWSLGKGLARHALVDLPRPMAKQAITWMRSREVVDTAGEPWMPEGSDLPILVLGASVDKVVPPANVAAACEIFEDCTYRLLGVEGGLEADYGHIDPLLTPQGAHEVFPIITDWLDEARGSAE